jgi:hypothetical protein
MEREGERERERERERGIEGGRERERETYRQTDIQRQRGRGRERQRGRGRGSGRGSGRERGREGEREGVPPPDVRLSEWRAGEGARARACGVVVQSRLRRRRLRPMRLRRCVPLTLPLCWYERGGGASGARCGGEWSLGCALSMSQARRGAQRRDCFSHQSVFAARARRVSAL